MTHDELVAEVDRRFCEAMATATGPDTKAIVQAVATENGIDYAELREICLDHWLCGPN